MNKNKIKKRNLVLVLALAAVLCGTDHTTASAGDFDWSGDIRVRNEVLNPNQTNRNRLRFRTGFKTVINDTLEANVRWATSGLAGTAGGNNSTNQNFNNFNDYVTFWDMAYVTYRPSAVERLKIHAGKMKNFFTTTPLLWDGDTNPDGLGEEYNFGAIVLRAAQWGQTTAVANNTGFYSYQVGWLGDNVELYVSNYVDTSTPGGNFMDYLGTYTLGAFKLTADYASETTLSKSGYWVSLGWNKVKSAGDLALAVTYAHYDDAFIPDFRDSDFTLGTTAALSNDGTIWGLGYGLEDNLEFNASYFATKRPTDQVDTSHLMLDLVAKF